MAKPKRKTFNVEEFVTWANNALAHPETPDVFTPEHKQGIIHALDHILHESGRYAGFRYLDSYDENDPEFAINGRKNVRRQYFFNVV